MFPCNHYKFVQTAFLAKGDTKPTELSLSVEFRRMVLGTGEDSIQSIAKSIAWGICTLGIAPAIAVFIDIFSEEKYNPAAIIIGEMGIRDLKFEDSYFQDDDNDTLNRDLRRL